MALPNPALIFQMPAALVVAASTGKDDVITAIEAAINALGGTDSNWTATTIDGDIPDTPATLISAPATSPISGFRAIIGGSNGAGTEPATAQCLTPDTQVANVLMLSIGPDGHSVSNNWYDPNPYGSGVRSSGFWRITPNAQITDIGVIASAETLTILMRGGANNQWRACTFGAILDPPELASAEASERIFGMSVMGNGGAWIPVSWQQVTSSFLFHSNSAGANHVGIFNPTAPATWISMTNSRMNAGIQSAATSATTLGNNKFLAPVYAYKYSSPSTTYEQILGRFRGIFGYEDGLMRGVLQDATLADRGYIVSNSTVATADSFIWANE